MRARLDDPPAGDAKSLTPRWTKKIGHTKLIALRFTLNGTLDAYDTFHRAADARAESHHRHLAASAHRQIERQPSALRATQRLVSQEKVTAEIIELAAGEISISETNAPRMAALRMVRALRRPVKRTIDSRFFSRSATKTPISSRSHARRQLVGNRRGATSTKAPGRLLHLCVWLRQFCARQPVAPDRRIVENARQEKPQENRRRGIDESRRRRVVFEPSLRRSREGRPPRGGAKKIL